MKTLKHLLSVISLLLYGIAISQNLAEPTAEYWTAFNREVSFNGDEIYLNAQENDGLLWLNNTNFKSGTVELDIKGKDVRGQSFVGVAFHGKDNETFDAVYFRPFNFQSEQRKTHSVQYIAMPAYDWSALRNEFPGKYESMVSPVPDPNGWFHAKIVIDFPSVKVFVNDSKEPSLEVEQISDRGAGQLGLWVGNGSDGTFKNIKITKK